MDMYKLYRPSTERDAYGQKVSTYTEIGDFEARITKADTLKLSASPIYEVVKYAAFVLGVKDIRENDKIVGNGISALVVEVNDSKTRSYLLLRDE